MGENQVGGLLGAAGRRSEDVPTRIVAGRCRGDIATAGDDPPKDNASFWTGSYLKMKVVSAGDWWAASKDNLLVRPDTGELIPYDPTGTASFGWHFTTNDSYATPTATVTQYVRVNGPAGTLDATLQWLYHWNQIPTDLYYSSLYCYVIHYQTIEVLGTTFKFPFVYEPLTTGTSPATASTASTTARTTWTASFTAPTSASAAPPSPRATRRLHSSTS